MGVYRRAMSYFTADWPLIVLTLTLIGIQTALGLIVAWPMAVLVDSVLTSTPRDSFMTHLFLAVLPASKLGQVIGLAVAGLLIKFAGDLLNMARTILTARINYSGLMRVRCDLYRKLQALTISYHRAQPQGDAIYRLSNDTFGCQAILQTLIATGVAIVTLVVMTALLMTRSVPLTLLALSIAPFLAITNIYYGNRLKKESLACKAYDAQFTTTIQRSMSMITLVQAYGREQEEFHRFRGSIRDCVKAWFRLHWQEVFYWLIVGTILGIGGALVFGYGGYLVWRDQFSGLPQARGHDGMTVGDLIVFTSYLGLLWDPLCKLTGAGASMQGGVAGAQRVFETLDAPVALDERDNPLPLPPQPRRLELHNVWFSYDGGGPILQGIDARIEPGQMVAFVGASGAGKSTLLNLLPRFYDPSGGALLLDGVDARRIRLRDLRKHVALVLQESVILPTTIAENIAYGRPQATDSQIRLAAEMAGAAEFIEKLPHGYRTEIREGGTNLSGGQRQRISIARALLTQAPIVILDEPTSALDPHHEHVITERLRALKGQRTIIIVSHRLQTVTACDQIFMMENGTIVERGTHAELMARRGRYWEMARHQIPEPPGRPEPAVIARAPHALEVLVH